MVIDLRRIYETVGERYDFDTEISRGRLDEIRGYSFIGPAAVNGAAENRAGVVTLNYSVKVTVNAECGRCLRRFGHELAFDSEYTLVRSLQNSENDEYIVTEDDKLDLDELAAADILLQMPTKLLCREDCKGLCPICGADLNVNDCDCVRDLG